MKGGFCSYDGPRAFSLSLSHAAASVSLHLCCRPSHLPSHLLPAPSSPPSGSLYWAALKPDVPVLQELAKGRGRVESFYSTSPFFFLISFSHSFPRIVAHITPPSSQYTNYLPLLPPLPVMRGKRPSSRLNQPFFLLLFESGEERMWL